MYSGCEIWAGPHPAPEWLAGCTAGRPGRSYGWHPGPCLPGSWSPSGCWRCSSWGRSDLGERGVEVGGEEEVEEGGEIKRIQHLRAIDQAALNNTPNSK